MGVGVLILVVHAVLVGAYVITLSQLPGHRPHAAEARVAHAAIEAEPEQSECVRRGTSGERTGLCAPDRASSPVQAP